MLLKVHPDTAYVISSIWLIVMTIIFIAITVYHIITTNKHHGLKCWSNKYSNSLGLSFLLIIFAFLVFIGLSLDIIDQFFFVNIKYCWFIKLFGPSCYTGFKIVSYSILIGRLHEAFNGSMVGYKPKLLLMYGIIMSLLFFTGTIFVSFTGGVELHSNQLPKCVVIWYLPAISYGLFTDIVIGLINLYLFIKPVLKLNNFIKNHTNNTDDSDLLKLATKQCILSVIVVASTLFILLWAIIVTSMHQVAMTIDLILSVTSIILMFAWNDILTDKLFKCCYKNEFLISKDVKMLIKVKDGSTTTKNASTLATQSAAESIDIEHGEDVDKDENIDNVPTIVMDVKNSNVQVILQ